MSSRLISHADCKQQVCVCGYSFTVLPPSACDDWESVLGWIHVEKANSSSSSSCSCRADSQQAPRFNCED